MDVVICKSHYIFYFSKFHLKTKIICIPGSLQVNKGIKVFRIIWSKLNLHKV